MTVNIAFFNSPAYRVPPITIMRRARLSTMNVPVRVPWRAGSAWYSGACRIVKFGEKPASAEISGRMNMFRTNIACHAFGVT
jgi:hypothetical protein